MGQPRWQLALEFNHFYRKVDISNDGAFGYMNKTSSNVSSSNTTPPWHRIINGLNIEGICTNKQCEAYNKKVICPKGFVVFNLNDTNGNSCPICKNVIKAITCCFSDCLWMFEGQKTLKSRFAPNIVSLWYKAEYRYKFLLFSFIFLFICNIFSFFK